MSVENLYYIPLVVETGTLVDVVSHKARMTAKAIPDINAPIIQHLRHVVQKKNPPDISLKRHVTEKLKFMRFFSYRSSICSSFSSNVSYQSSTSRRRLETSFGVHDDELFNEFVFILSE